MSDEYTTDDIQEQFVAGAMITGVAYSRNEAREWFKEWLAAHDCTVKTEAIRDAAEKLDRIDAETYVTTWLRARADQMGGADA